MTRTVGEKEEKRLGWTGNNKKSSEGKMSEKSGLWVAHNGTCFTSSLWGLVDGMTVSLDWQVLLKPRINGNVLSVIFFFLCFSVCFREETKGEKNIRRAQTLF